MLNLIKIYYKNLKEMKNILKNISNNKESLFGKFKRFFNETTPKLKLKFQLRSIYNNYKISISNYDIEKSKEAYKSYKETFLMEL